MCVTENGKTCQNCSEDGNSIIVDTDMMPDIYHGEPQFHNAMLHPKDIVATNQNLQEIRIVAAKSYTEVMPPQMPPPLHLSSEQPLSKPETLNVEIWRVGPHFRILGLLLTVRPGSDDLVVEDVLEPSLVSDWNRNHGPRKQVCIGDMLLGVNGVRNSSTKLLQTLKSSIEGDCLVLELKRGQPN